MLHVPARAAAVAAGAEALRLRFGAQGLRSARELLGPALPPAISTGLPALDALGGCRGLPRGAISLLSGRSGSGKSTVAFRALAQAQAQARGQAPARAAKPPAGDRARRAGGGAEGGSPVLLLDLSRSCDPGYLAACGVDLGRLILARPRGGAAAVALLMDLLRQEALPLVVVHSLADLLVGDGAQALQGALPHCVRLLRRSGTALLLLDDPQAPWLPAAARRDGAAEGVALLQPWAALHLRLEREAGGRAADEAAGSIDEEEAAATDEPAGIDMPRSYRSLARLLRSRWRAAPALARLEIPAA